MHLDELNILSVFAFALLVSTVAFALGYHTGAGDQAVQVYYEQQVWQYETPNY